MLFVVWCYCFDFFKCKLKRGEYDFVEVFDEEDEYLFLEDIIIEGFVFVCFFIFDFVFDVFFY